MSESIQPDPIEPDGKPDPIEVVIRDKDDDKKRKEPDRSPPVELDAALTDWIEELFEGGGKVSELTVSPVYGRWANRIGEPIKKLKLNPFTAPPTRSDFVRIANKLMGAMQSSADAARRESTFRCEALNDLRGGVFDVKMHVVLPHKGTVRMPAAAAQGDHDPDEEGVDPLGGDILRNRCETVLRDGRFYAENILAAIDRLDQSHTNVEKLLFQLVQDGRQQNARLSEQLFAEQRARNAAENNQLDRELLRKEKEWALNAKSQGLAMLTGLVPDLGKKLLAGVEGDAKPNANAATSPPAVETGRTPESVLIEGVLAPLTPEEKRAVFGAWTDRQDPRGEGVLLQAGILGEEQVRLIVAVLRQEVPPERLDALLGGPLQITTAQYIQINSAIDMRKIKPLLDELKARKARQPQAN